MVKSLKCLTCGGDLQFNPSLQKWKCEWCDSEFTKEDLGDSLTDAPEFCTDTAVCPFSEEEIQVFKCSYCGAEVVTDCNTAATMCCYCQRPIALGARLMGKFKPCVLIPFQNTKDQAMQAFKNYLKDKKFVPNSYLDNQNIEKLTGVYIPFWIYKGEVVFNMQGEGDKVKIKKTANHIVQETSTFSVKREGKITIETLPVDASSRTPNEIMDSIEPFDFKLLRDFNTHYLSGFLAEKYDEEEESLYSRAKQRFEGSAENRIRDSLKEYKTVRRSIDKKKIENMSSKYGLLPVWLLYSNYEGNQYVFAMNGQSGKLIGDLPIDKGKVRKYSILMFLMSSIGVSIVTFILIWFLTTPNGVY